mgnify:CR=1 FL=1
MFNRSFTVETTPVAKGRPKFRRIGNFVSTYSPKKTKDYETLIKEAAIQCMGKHDPLETPVSLSIAFGMPLPKSYSKKRKEACLTGIERHLKKPDLDNMIKSVSDAMNGIVYRDDGQIVTITARKSYQTEPCVFIWVREIVP